jgi:hypothetical protein
MSSMWTAPLVENERDRQLSICWPLIVIDVGLSSQSWSRRQHVFISHRNHDQVAGVEPRRRSEIGHFGCPLKGGPRLCHGSR